MLLPECNAAVESETDSVGKPVVAVLHCTVADDSSCHYSTYSLAEVRETDLAALVCSGRMMVAGMWVFDLPFEVVVVCVAIALIGCLSVVSVAVCTFVTNDSVCRN